MWDIAYAQGAPGLTGPSPVMTILPFILIFVIMYFLVIRPQQKKGKEHQEMLNKLKKNDEVMTSGGIYGKVVALADSVVTLEVAPNVRIRVHRPQISAVVTGEKSSSKEVRSNRMRRSVAIRLALFIVATLVSLVYLRPTFVHDLPPWWSSFLPTDRIHLGLDLQGGSHLLLEVKVDKAIENNVERIRADFTNVLRDRGISGVSVERVRAHKSNSKFRLRASSECGDC